MLTMQAATGTVRRLESFAGAVTLLHGKGRRYDASSAAGAFSLKMVRGGSASWTTQGRSLTLHESLFAFLPPDTPYRIVVDSETPVETTCLFFPDALLPSLGEAIAGGTLDGAPTVPVDWPVRRSGGLTSVMDPLVRMVTGEWTPSREELDDVLLTTVPRLFAKQLEVPADWRLSATRASTRLELVARVTTGRDFLLDHLSEPIDLRSAAAAATLSPFHFHRTFRAVFGIPPLRFVTERRLERAAFLLRHGRASVTDVCLASGFDSLSSFSRAFTRRFGAPPGRYRTSRLPPAAD